MAVFNTFTFDGENSLDYGIYITGEAVYNAPERAVEMVSIPGKNGALALDQGRFENIEVTYSAGTFGAEQVEFAGRMRAMRNMLASRYNYVRLTDSYHPEEYRLGLYKSGLEATPVAMSSAGEFDITFNCKPQRFLTSGEEPVDTSELGGEVTTDTEPYLFRRSGGGRIGHDFDAEIDKIIGGTVAWNQSIKELNSTNWGNDSQASATYSDGVATVSASAGNNGIKSPIKVVNNHKYLLNVEYNSPSSTYKVAFGANYIENTYVVVDVASGDVNKWLSYTKVIKGLADATPNYYLYVSNVAYSNVKFRNVMLIDLTALFGSAEIADYVYSLEQTTAGAGIAWLKSHGFIDGSYRAYDSGSLQCVKTSAHVMRDENDVVIGNYPLDPNLELRGKFKLDANNNLYAEGDIYPPSGEVSRRFSEPLDLGTLNWIKSEGEFFITTDPLMADMPYGFKLICSRYSTFGGGPWMTMPDKNVADAKTTGFSSVFGRVLVHDTTYSSSTASEFKTAMSGVYLVYELATPTTEQADPYANQQIVSPLGTEEYIDTRDVPVPVGHETKYGMSQLVLTNPTEFPSKPLLEVTGVGTFWLGDTLFTITGTAGQTIYIDCETGESWKNVGGIITPANGLVTLNRLDFPELDPGDTPVMYGTGITKVVVTPRWWII